MLSKRYSGNAVGKQRCQPSRVWVKKKTTRWHLKTRRSFHGEASKKRAESRESRKRKRFMNERENAEHSLSIGTHDALGNRDKQEATAPPRRAWWDPQRDPGFILRAVQNQSSILKKSDHLNSTEMTASSNTGGIQVRAHRNRGRPWKQRSPKPRQGSEECGVMSKLLVSEEEMMLHSLNERRFEEDWVWWLSSDWMNSGFPWDMQVDVSSRTWRPETQAGGEL